MEMQEVVHQETVVVTLVYHEIVLDVGVPGLY